MKKLEKFLEFNGKRIAILLADGSWWVAIKPICDALYVQYEAQRIRISEHRILGQLPCKHMVVATDGKLREMLCLPEKYIYGWLFSINSESAELIEYQEKCYEVLYSHFHGTMTGRMNALTEMTETDLKILELQEKLDTKLLESDEYQTIQSLKQQKKGIKKKLRDLDIELVTGQLSLVMQ